MAAQDATERFYALVWPHAPTVLRTARFLMRDPAEAEDLAQETMLKAFRSLDGFREGPDAAASTRAWLLTILRHARVDRVRSRAARAAHEAVSLEQLVAEPADPDAPAPGEDVAAWDNPEQILQSFSDAQVIEALGKLPEDIRWTLLLVDVEGLEQQDAAAVLGVPVGTVKSRTHRGRAMLRQALLPVARDLRLVK